MSLLLDALKKAAEQKAAKNRQPDAYKQAPDETGASDASAANLASEFAVPDQDSHLDETEIDDLTIGQVMGEHDFVGERDPGREDTDLTGKNLDPAQTKSSFITSESTGNDDTEMTAGDFEQTRSKIRTAEKPATGDDTEIQFPKSELTQLDPSELYAAGSDQSENLQITSQKRVIEDDTELTGAVPEKSEDLQLGAKMEAGDDTDLTGGTISRVFDEDQTLLLSGDDVGEFMGDNETGQEQPEQSAESQVEDEKNITGPFVDDDTVIQADSEPSEFSIDSEPAGETSVEDYSVSRADGEQSNVAVEDNTSTTGEDYSISLFQEDYSVSRADGEQSNVAVEDSTSTTGEDYSISLFDEAATPFAPDGAKSGDASRDASMGDATIPELSLADKTGLRGLTVFDISEHSETDPNADRADITQPTSVSTDLEAPSKTVTRADTTSTETYAPDNYDRTLQRSENRDASNYFTGMKSDTGTVLTAEHAKKIFHSKSSSQRMQKFKLYGGLVVVILVVFFGMGVYQLDGEIEKIDNSQRPLKRDPLPGLIKNVADQGFTDVLAAASGSEVDSRVLKLVEGAEMGVGIDEVVVEIGLEVPDPPEGTNESQTDGYQDEPEAVSMEVSVQPPMEVSEQQPAAVSEPVIEASANDLSDDATGPVTSARFQISTRTTITEKDQWLLEAYAAYQRGDDETAWAKYNAVLEIDPENRNALLARAAMNIHNNNIAAAIRDYRVLLIANPKDSLAISSLTAVVNISPEQSESQLKLLIRDEPDSPYLNFALGNVYGAQNRWQEAQGQYFTALEHNPDDPNYAYNLAVSLEHIARPSVAISYYQLALDNFNKGLATFNRDVVDQRLEMLRQL